MANTNTTSKLGDRFPSPTHQLDIAPIIEELLPLARDHKQGHAQRTLHKHGNTTAALFVFKQDGTLPQHTAPAFVTITVLTGTVFVRTDPQYHKLTAPAVLTLDPHTPHDVLAHTDAAILLHITLN